MPSQQAGSSNSGQKGGIGPHFNADTNALMGLYTLHLLTHEEFRSNLASMGLKLDPWPEGFPKPLLYKLWRAEEGSDDPFPDLDDQEADDISMFIPEINPPSVTEEAEDGSV